MKKKLVVFGVAINRYAIASYRLNGCRNDLTGLLEYLQENYETDQYRLSSTILTDKDATREAVVSTFLSHFEQLEKGDTGLFYFSGHGSQARAPEAFWHDSPGKKHQTFVCYDSRIEGNRDLYDKELGYLIWKVTREKDVHFTVIMDCCHSGSGTRDLEQEKGLPEVGIRMASSSEVLLEARDYLGVKEYRREGQQLYAPVGNHILLSACRRTEKAKERILNCKSRGVFTYSLLEALRKSSNKLTYGELERRIQAKVYNTAFDQHPQIESYGINQARAHYFLGGGIRERATTFLVSYDNLKGWLFNQGSLHGLNLQTNSSPNKIRLFSTSERGLNRGDELEVALDQVYSTFSTVVMPTDIDKSSQFSAEVIQISIPKLRISIATGSEQTGIDYFNSEWQAATSAFLDLRKNTSEAQYEIHAQEGFYFVKGKEVERNYPLFYELSGYNEKTANQLMKNLEKIAQWHHVKSIENPYSALSESSIEMTFYEVESVSPDFRVAELEKVVPDFISTPRNLNYRSRKVSVHGELKFEEPSFRLNIKNPLNGRRPLWVSLLYLGSDFCVSNQLLPLQLLEPGQDCWIETFESGYLTSVISLHLQDAYLKRGVHEIVEHFKLFISTDEFNTHTLNQTGLPLEADVSGNRRGLNRKERAASIDTTDWKTVDFAVRIVHP